MATCDDCNCAEDEKGGVEWRATKDKWQCAKCNYLDGQGGSRTPRRGGMGSGGLGRSNY